MTKKNSNKFTGVFKIFFSSIKSYFLYLDQCAKNLAFPIFGQVISIIAIFALTKIFVDNFDNFKNFNPFFENEKNLIITFFVILSPLFFILIKAIFDYLIAFASLNLLFYTTSGKSKVKNIDFSANNNVIKRKLPAYIFLLLIISILSIPPLIIILPFLCLCIQIFALEGDVSAIYSVKRSFQLVKSNVIPTIIMLLLCYLTTYAFLPNLFLWSFDKISFQTFAIGRFETLFFFIPFSDFNDALSAFVNNITSGVIQIPSNILNPLDCAISTYKFMISFIIIGFTLPFRCYCFTELYKIYDADKIKENSKQTDEIIKRATKRKRNNV